MDANPSTTPQGQQSQSAQTPQSQSSVTTQQQSSHKTPRVLACVLCQHRKIKCDRNTPCSNCIKVCRSSPSWFRLRLVPRLTLTGQRAMYPVYSRSCSEEEKTEPGPPGEARPL